MRPSKNTIVQDTHEQRRPRQAAVRGTMPLKRFNKIDQFEFHHTLAEADGVNIVFFTNDTCPSCRYWKALLDRYLKRRLDVRVFEVDVEKELALTREFGVFHLPALFLYVDGEFRSELQSQAAMDSLDAAIETALMRPPEEIP